MYALTRHTFYEIFVKIYVLLNVNAVRKIAADMGRESSNIHICLVIHTWIKITTFIRLSNFLREVLPPLWDPHGRHLRT